MQHDYNRCVSVRFVSGPGPGATDHGSHWNLISLIFPIDCLVGSVLTFPPARKGRP